MRAIGIFFLVVLLGAGLATTIVLHRENAARRARLAELRKSVPGGAVRGTQPTAVARAHSGPARANPEEIDRLRAEIAGLEKRAAEQYSRNSEGGEASAGDPEQGMTRLENLSNVGQSTPAKAFQTLAWAALKGDEQAMAQVIGLNEPARRKIEAFIASLPDEGRKTYATPEKVMALFLSKALVNVSAIEITQTTMQDPQNATITVRGLLGNDQDLPMRLGASGWQLVEGENQVDWALTQLSLTPPKG